MTILDYRQKLEQHRPCKDGAEAFAKCKSRRDVFELIGSPLATDFFLKSIADGWGPSPEDFNSFFQTYVNGKQTIVNKIGERKVKSQIWCKADNVSVPGSVRWLILIGCRGEVIVGDWQVVKIFVDANSSVRIKCAPNSIVYVDNYGGEIRGVEGECKIKKAI